MKGLGWSVFELIGVETAQAFFHAAMQALPMDPAISGRVNWNALSDSLFGGIDASIKKRVAIVWHGADLLLETDPESFSIAQIVLADVSDCLRRERNERRTEACLRSFLLGKGEQFRILKAKDLEPVED